MLDLAAHFAVFGFRCPGGGNGRPDKGSVAAPEEVQAYMNAETALSNAVLNSMQHIHWEEVPMEIPDGEDLSF